jgi:hypothetical protein
MSLNAYQKSALKQTRLWIKGISTHSDGPDKECLPDFSCCGYPIANLERRIANYTKLCEVYGVAPLLPIESQASSE